MDSKASERRMHAIRQLLFIGLALLSVKVGFAMSDGVYENHGMDFSNDWEMTVFTDGETQELIYDFSDNREFIISRTIAKSSRCGKSSNIQPVIE